MIYERITQGNFTPTSLDGFVRRQEVEECWRKRDGRWMLLPIAYVEDWNLEDRRRRAESILQCVKDGGIAYGAWEGEQLIGFAQLSGPRFGSREQYIDLARFHVSAPFRRQGIGKELFRRACQGARELGAKKLYISAHSAKEPMAAYYAYGCVEAEEIYWPLAKKEPCDVQLEYPLDAEEVSADRRWLEPAQ
ncbi:MAG: GNAT family N-acetyltransferase [Oscillospiraceae bacterium]|nr:GNAT family N-acetyltransferase [Oscillospiraceae bacterium]